MRGKYTYGGSADGALLKRIVRECAVIAARYDLRPDDFDDVVHDALLACTLKQAKAIPAGVQIWTHVQWIVKTAAKTSCRRLIRGVSAEASAEFGGHEVAADPAVDASPSPTLRRLVSMLTVAIDSLTPRQRQVIVLRYGMEGHHRHTITEAAAAMGVSTGALRSHAARAMKTMRSTIEDLADAGTQSQKIGD